jgi:rhamnose transport system substrate-binding protein
MREAGETFQAGKLGRKTIEEDPDLGLNVLLGPPFVFNADNIDDFDFQREHSTVSKK